MATHSLKVKAITTSLMVNYALLAKQKKTMTMMTKMKYSNDKDIQNFVRERLKDKSFTIKYGKKHNFLAHGNRKLSIPSTPSDFRSFQQFKHDVNRYLGH